MRQAHCCLRVERSSQRLLKRVFVAGDVDGDVRHADAEAFFEELHDARHPRADRCLLVLRNVSPEHYRRRVAPGVRSVPTLRRRRLDRGAGGCWRHLFVGRRCGLPAVHDGVGKHAGGDGGPAHDHQRRSGDSRFPEAREQSERGQQPTACCGLRLRLVTPGREVGPVIQLELAADVPDVELDRRDAEAEANGDLGVRGAGAHLVDDAPLRRCQHIGIRRPPTSSTRHVPNLATDAGEHPYPNALASVPRTGRSAACRSPRTAATATQARGGWGRPRAGSGGTAAPRRAAASRPRSSPP